MVATAKINVAQLEAWLSQLVLYQIAYSCVWDLTAMADVTG